MIAPTPGDNPSEAEYWHRFCRKSIPASRAILDCVWAKMILAQIADAEDTVGTFGRRWRFADGSSLIAHPHDEIIR